MKFFVLTPAQQIASKRLFIISINNIISYVHSQLSIGVKASSLKINVP